MIWNLSIQHLGRARRWKAVMQSGSRGGIKQAYWPSHNHVIAYCPTTNITFKTFSQKVFAFTVITITSTKITLNLEIFTEMRSCSHFFSLRLKSAIYGKLIKSSLPAAQRRKKKINLSESQNVYGRRFLEQCAYKSGYKKLTAVTRAYYSWEKNHQMRLWPLFSPYDTPARNSIGIRGHNLSIYHFFGFILLDLTKQRHDFAIFYWILSSLSQLRD